MGTPKMTGFLIALVLVSLFSGLFIFTTTSISSSYGVTYDNSTLLKYSNKMDDLSLLANKTKESLRIEERAGFLDIIGGYFSAAYQALLYSTKSFDIFTDMADDAFSDSNLAFEDKGINSIGRMLSIALITIVIILIFVGIVMSVLVKRERL